MDSITLIDTNSILCKVFYYLSARNSNSKLESSWEDYFNHIVKCNSEYICFCFDPPKKLGKTIRRKRSTSYKSNRKKEPPELTEFRSFVWKHCRANKVLSLYYWPYEADDLIASLSKKFRDNMNVWIMSTDKDLYQCYHSSGNVGFKKINPTSQGLTTHYFGEEASEFSLGIKCHQVTDFLSMVGDSADNIPGIQGLGKTKVLQLLNRFGSYSNCLQASFLEENKSDKLLSIIRDDHETKNGYADSLNLVTLYSDLPINIDLQKFRNPFFMPAEDFDYTQLTEMELWNRN